MKSDVKELCNKEFDDIIVNDFKPEFKHDPLKKEIIVFQGQKERKLNLGRLIGIENWNCYVADLFLRGIQNEDVIIDSVALVEILERDKLIVGSQPLRTDSLAGGYAFLSLEINKETFGKKLVYQGPDNNYIYIISGIKGNGKIHKIITELGLTNNQEVIKNHSGDIHSDKRIRITESEIKDKTFKEICHDNPEKKIFLIVVNAEKIYKLEKFYNPDFYLKREFKKVVMKKNIKQLLTENNLSETFIFSGIDDLEKMVELLGLENKNNPKVKFFMSENAARVTFQSLRRQNETVHWLKFESKQLSRSNSYVPVKTLRGFVNGEKHGISTEEHSLKYELVWHNSHGSLDILQKYAENTENEYFLVGEEDLFKEIIDREIIVIVDQQGMGKTTTLTKFYESKHQRNSFIETHWIIEINLMNHLQAIRNTNLSDSNIDSIVELLGEINSELNDKLIKKALSLALGNNKKLAKPILLNFDGLNKCFDEEDVKKIISLLKFLRNEVAAKICITTNPHYQQTLENELSTFAITEKYQNVIISNKIKKELIKKELHEHYILYCANNKQITPTTLGIRKKKEKELFQSNRDRGKVKIFSSNDEAESAFQEFCRQNETVHWIRYTGKDFIWFNSNGSLDTLRKYISNSEEDSTDIDNPIQEIRNRKIIIFIDNLRTEEVTPLIKLSNAKNESKASFLETHWVIKINLKDHLKYIEDEKFDSIDTDSVVTFLSKINQTDVELNHNLTKSLLRVALNKKKHFLKPLILIFDELDEVLHDEPEQKEKIIKLLKFLNNKTNAKLYITTSVCYQQILEKELSTFAIRFYPMDYKAYVKKYLKDRLYLVLNDDKFNQLFNENEENKIIQIYAESFFKKMKSIFTDDISRFLGTPIQLCLLLNDSVTHFKDWINKSAHQNPNFNYLGNNMYEVYENFFNLKCKFYFEKENITKNAQQKEDKTILDNYCKKLAASNVNSLFSDFSDKEIFEGKVLSAGFIVYGKNTGFNAPDRAMEFIHTTFNHYFAAKYIFQYIEQTNIMFSEIVHKYILTDILRGEDYQLIRRFINFKLKTVTKTELQDSMKHFGKIAENLFKENRSSLIDSRGTVLHIAVEEDNVNIVHFLLNSLSEHIHILCDILCIHDEEKKNKSLKKILNLDYETRDDYNEIFKILNDAAKINSENELDTFLEDLGELHLNNLNREILKTGK